MSSIRRPELVLRALDAGREVVRERNHAGKFVHRLGPDLVDDLLVRRMVERGELTVRSQTPDAERVVYVRGSTTPAARPAAQARRTDGQTSHAAAAAVGDVTPSHREVLVLFSTYGNMTTAQLCTIAHSEARRMGRAPYSDSRYRSACAELERQLLLQAVGKRPTGHTSKSGVATYAIEWGLTDAGAAVVGRRRPAAAG